MKGSDFWLNIAFVLIVHAAVIQPPDAKAKLHVSDAVVDITPLFVTVNVTNRSHDKKSH